MSDGAAASTTIHGVVLAAGEGRRMGSDKALLDLAGRTAIERVAEACRDGGLDGTVIVRVAGAEPLPASVTDRARVVEMRERADMMASVRTGLGALEPGVAALVFPVDYALVDADVVDSLGAAMRGREGAITLPLEANRPGHPIGLGSAVVAEILGSDATTLRDVVGRDPDRVHVVPVDNPWVHHDLDTPEDLAAALEWLRA